MNETTSLRFAAAARAIAAAARGRGYVAPSFRSPPRVASADRTLRRRPEGGAVVAIRLRGRPWPAVLADMVEGTVVANDLAGPEADRCRSWLWGALDAAMLLPAPLPPPPVAARLATETGVGRAVAVVGAAPMGSRPPGPIAQRARRASQPAGDRPGRPVAPVVVSASSTESAAA